jgi:hypothetical protein
VRQQNLPLFSFFAATSIIVFPSSPEESKPRNPTNFHPHSRLLEERHGFLRPFYALGGWQVDSELHELGRALSGFLESRDRLKAVMESAQWDREIH